MEEQINNSGNSKSFFKKMAQLSLPIKIILLAIPIIVFGYLIFSGYKSYSYKANYSVVFDNENYKNTSLPLYVNESLNNDKFGETINENGNKYARVMDSPISIIWQPEEYLQNKTIDVKARIKDEGDWSIMLKCNGCKTKQVFTWDNFYFGKLNDYEKSASFEGMNIYTKGVNIISDNIENANEWIKQNAIEGSSILIVNNVMSELFAMKDIDNSLWEDKETVIDYTVRGPHQYYVMLKDKLDMTVNKGDYNYTEGADDIKVQLFDQNDQMIFDGRISDDGNTAANRDNSKNESSKRFIKDVEKGGVYRLVFAEGTENKWHNDFYVNNIKINTGKIVLDTKKNPVDIASKKKLYTQIIDQQDLLVQVWMDWQLKNLEISSTTDSVYNFGFSKEDLNSRKKIQLPAGNYWINNDFERKIGGAFLASSPENYFEPLKYNFLYDSTSRIEPKIIVINYDFEKDGDWIIAKKTFKSSDYPEINNWKKIEFSLKNEQLAKTNDYYAMLADKEYFPVSQFQDFLLLSKSNDTKSKSSNSNNFEDWIAQETGEENLIATDIANIAIDYPSISNRVQNIVIDNNFKPESNINYLLIKVPYGQNVYIKDFSVDIK